MYLVSHKFSGKNHSKFLIVYPIITLDLKHEKNQTVHDAVAQYVNRDHGDRIFQLPFLHIAADTSDVMVATDPSQDHYFRWYNTGLRNTPDTEGEYPVEFLYREGTVKGIHFQGPLLLPDLCSLP